MFKHFILHIKHFRHNYRFIILDNYLYKSNPYMLFINSDKVKQTS